MAGNAGGFCISDILRFLFHFVTKITGKFIKKLEKNTKKANLFFDKRKNL